jgi:hypothetical protein
VTVLRRDRRRGPAGAAAQHNIDTPETVDPEVPVQCLGPEATEFLKGLLPIGTAVTAEIARQGLGEG